MKIIFLLFSLMLFFSCNYSEEDELNVFFSRLPNDFLISIKTYDGGGQVVHPDVLFNNGKLIMAITPYPYFNDSLENPCLYKSYDGVYFEEFIEGVNPLVKTPQIDHNCDPDIILDEEGNLVLFYLETQRPKTNKVIALKHNKKDNTFKSKTVVNYNLNQNESFILSPSVVKSSNKNYFMFFVNNDLETNRIEYIESNNLDYFDKDSTKNIQINFPRNYYPWHLDVIKKGDKYYLLTNGYYEKPEKENYSIFLAESTDLIHWKNNREIITKENSQKNVKYLYRASALFTETQIAVWYSYVDNDFQWKLAVKKMNL